MPVVVLRNQTRAWYNGVEQTRMWLGGNSVWTRPEPVVPLRQFLPITNTRQIHSGHSLTDILFGFAGSYIGGYARLAEYIGVPDVFDNIRKSTMPGSPTDIRWNADYDAFGVGDNARYDIANYDLLSITEGGPIAAPYTDNIYTQGRLETDCEYLKLFIQNARMNGAGGNGAQTLLYTMWPNIDGMYGEFRSTLDEYEKSWHYRQEYVNNELGGYLHIVPGHRVMMRIYDDIQSGLVPGITDIHDLFLDDIHPNGWGSYPIMCLHIACVYGVNPVGLPYDFIVRDDNEPEVARLTAELATYFQTIAWQIATTYARAGLGGFDMGTPGYNIPLELFNPRDILGNRLVFAIDYRPLSHEDTGPVNSLIGDGITLTSMPGHVPIKTEDGTVFDNAVLMGDVDISGPRYSLRVIKVNSVVGEHHDVSVGLGNGVVFWHNGDNHLFEEGRLQTYNSSSPNIGGVPKNREIGEFFVIEQYWDETKRWARIVGREPLTTQEDTITLPVTTKIQVGGNFDVGDSGDELSPANVTWVSHVWANSEPTPEERNYLIRWATHNWLTSTPTY